MPDPAEIRDLGGLIEALNLLRAASGNPSFRTLAKSVGAELRPPQVLAHTTVRDLFQVRRRRLDIDLLTATVRALGADEDETVRWRQACARVHAEAKVGGAAGVLRQLPAETAVFTGRERDLAAVLAPVAVVAAPGTPGAPGTSAASVAAGRGRRASGTVTVSAIEGMAGVGKTQLALHAAHRLVSDGLFDDVQLYVDLRGFDPERPPADPADVLDAFLRQLGVADRQIPGALDERAAMFRDRMHGRDAVLVLDNAADGRQVQHLLPASSTCFVLVTSRRSMTDLEGASHHALDVFEDEDALRLLASVVGAERVEAEPEAAARIVQACGWLPLAVSIAAARLKSRAAWTLEELARRLQAGPGAIVSAERSLRAVFDLSHRGLAPAAREMFEVLGQHPGNDFTPLSAAALAGVDAESAEAVLEGLLDENLLSQQSFGRYTMHDLLRQYARQLSLGAAVEKQAATRARLLDYYLHASHHAAMVQAPGRDPIRVPLPVAAARPTPLAELPPTADGQSAADWFDTEFEALRELIADCAEAEPVAAWQLAWSVVGHCVKTARSAELAALQTIALRAAESVDNTTAMIYSLQARALGNSARGDFHQAIADLERSVELSREIGEAFYEARGLSNLAASTDHIGDRMSGLKYAEEALEAARSLGPDGRAEQARNLNLIGFNHAHLGQLDKAVAACRESLELAEEVGDPWIQGVALDSLGFAYRKAGEYVESADAYRRAVAIHRSNGAVLYQARTLTHLADLHEVEGDVGAALAVLEEALAIFEVVDEPLADETRQRIAGLRG